jgi:hypothetical protein
MITRRRGESDAGIVELCRGAFDEPTQLALNYGVVYKKGVTSPGNALYFIPMPALGRYLRNTFTTAE